MAEMCSLCPPTTGKQTLVLQIIQRVEYSVQMARVNKSSQNVAAHWGKLLYASVQEWLLARADGDNQAS